jgi:MOSC domain-containing protein YiiM
VGTPGLGLAGVLGALGLAGAAGAGSRPMVGRSSGRSTRSGRSVRGGNGGGLFVGGKPFGALTLSPEKSVIGPLQSRPVHPARAVNPSGIGPGGPERQPAPRPVPSLVMAPELVAAVTEVFVGLPGVIGTVGGHPVESAIAKARVVGDEIELRRLNLDGDRQADLSVHGGPDKAVYVYPTAHYPDWQAEGFAVDVGGLGENVALAGVTEHDVRLGDIWLWGEALVQVSQPRAPCFKLALHTGRKDIGPRMQATGRSGWYLRVLAAGRVPTHGPMTLQDRPDGAPTLHETFTVMFGGGGPRRSDPDGPDGDVLARVLASPFLAASWREPLAARRG